MLIEKLWSVCIIWVVWPDKLSLHYALPSWWLIVMYTSSPRLVESC